MYRRAPPLQNLPWAPYNRFRALPNHISYPNNRPIRRPVTRRAWDRTGVFVGPRKEARRNWEKEVTESKSTGPPPGFEDRQNQRRSEKEKEDSFTNRASNTVYISNVSIQMRSEEVTRCCEVYGEVERISYLKSYKFPESMVCFVRYRNKGQAEIAQRRLGGTRRYGKVWRVSWAKTELQPILNHIRKNIGDQFIEVNSDKGDSERKIMGEENEEMQEILKNSWIMVNEKHKPIEEIRELIDSYGGQEICLIQWGAYGNIAVCKNEELAGEWDKRLEELKEHFVKIEKLDPKEKKHSRFCWIDVKGIPIQAWSIGTMVNIAKQWGKLLALDIETDKAFRLDIARLFIETNNVEKVQGKKNIWFQNECFQFIVEEVERDGDIYVNLSQNSALVKTPIIADGGVAEGFVTDGGGKQRNNYDEKSMEESGENAQQKNLEVPLSNGDDLAKEKNWDSSTMEKEGCGDTQVAETPPLRGVEENRTPIFVSKSTASKRGAETCMSSRRENVKIPSGDKVVEGCTCCVKFHKKENKRLEGVEVNKDQIGREAQEKRVVIRERVKRRSGGKKIKTPKRRAQGILRKGLFAKETNITKNKGKQGRKKRKEGEEDVYGLIDTSSTSVEIVNEGLDLCEELGVKIKCNSAKRLQFEEFMREPTKSIEQEGETNTNKA